ncbi:MAG TPA: hypothetical protein VEA38_09995 [Terriglobales bacterium]|nr:hypothetical protein [Terriglobales bacterium]
MIARTTVVVAIAALTLLSACPAAADDAAAFVTEITGLARGTAEVKRGAAAWAPAEPLAALRAGDTVRTTGEGRVVIIHHPGGAPVTITAATSPHVVQRAQPRRGEQQMRVITTGLVEFFIGKQSLPSYRRAVSRDAGPPPPGIVSPRHTRLFGGPVVFEWQGPADAYALRVLGPQGEEVWRTETRQSLQTVYPLSAPPLQPGVRYTWELTRHGAVVERSSFELLTEGDARRVYQALEALSRGAPDLPPGTLTVLRTAILFDEGLFVEARRELERAAGADDPTIQLLLGHVYHQIGLEDRAAVAFARAARRR